MPKANVALFSFNRGIVGGQALARVDLERMRMSAETQTNWLPRALGSMSLRPGLEYLLSTYNDGKAVAIPFIYSMTQTAILECSNGKLRPLVNEAVITRASVSTVVTNGDFSSGTGWGLTLIGGATATISGGKLTLACVAIGSSARVLRSVSVAAADENVEHALRIVVDNGPVIFRCGVLSGTDDLISTTRLDTGTHSLAFTPGASSFYVEFESREARQIIVDSISIEAAGTLVLDAPWDEDDLSLLRWTQSGDVVFIASYGNKPKRIERRSTRSWSIVDYKSNDGPFFAYPSDPAIRLFIDTAVGNGTVSATNPFFSSSHVGAMLRVFTPGYNAAFDLGNDDVYTPAVRVNGVGSARNVSVVTTGTWAGTLTVQKSYVGEDVGFTDTATTITTNTTTSVTDTSDNVVMWVRVGFGATGHTSGLATVRLTFGTGGGGSRTASPTSVGGRTGVARITAVASSTSASIEILSPFSSDQGTYDWAESEWSDKQGWPSAVAIHESRLCWAGRDRLWGSVSDGYTSFNPATEGDSGPLQRSIGFGPIQIINWLVSLPRLMIGTEAAEVMVRSSTFDEPLTPVNFTLKDISTYGSSRVAGVKSDMRGLFVEKSGQRLMETSYDLQGNDFVTADLTRLCPDLFLNNAITKIAIQRQPDTRVHCVRTDGTVAVVVYEPMEEVRCWWIIETDGVVEDVAVLPTAVEDSVYYIVKRTIDGSTKRYYERFAREDECVGSTLNKQADCFKTYSGTATETITGLDHLEGKEVVVWGDGVDLSPDVDGVQTTYTVSGGSITLPVAVSSCVVGLPYTADFKSTKLAYAAGGGTALNQVKRVNQIGLILHKTHHKGLLHGRDFDHLDPLPDVQGGVIVPANTIHAHFDFPMMTHNGDWDSDARLCLRAKAPRPVTVLGTTIEVNTNG